MLRGLFGTALGVAGATVGTAAGATAGVAGSLQGRERKMVFNPEMVSRMFTEQRTIRNRNRYDTTLPDVSGDMVMGMYDFRGGNR